MDARHWRGDDVAAWKYPSLLEGFPDGHSINGSPETSCINRKGFLLFLSYCQIWVQEVQKVQWVQVRSIRPIRSIRVRIETSRGQAVYPCLSPCDGCKDPQVWWCGCLKISKLAWGFSERHSINGSQETSCVIRKGFLLFLSYVPLKEQRWG